MKSVNKVLLMSHLFTVPSVAQAYVGPGAGLSAIGSILAFLVAILLLVVGFLWYPIKRLIKGKEVKRKKDSPDRNQPLTRSTSKKKISERDDR